MFFNKNKYVSILNQDINGFCFKIKKQYKKFPLKSIIKLYKINKDNGNMTIIVDDVEYELDELINKFKTTYRELGRKTIKSYYSYVVHDFIKNTRNKSDNEISKIFEEYQEELQSKFKETRNDMWFCLHVLKELNKLSKNKNIIEESLSEDNIFDKIIEFNKELNNYEYIIPNNGNIITNVKRYSFDYYKLLSPSEFKKYHGGICWDYVQYEADYFKKNFNDIKFKTYFHVIDNGNDMPTHTFLLFNKDNIWYWFESSWKKHIGIHGYNSEKEALQSISYLLQKNIKHNGCYIAEYNTFSMKYGIDCEEYMKYFENKIHKIIPKEYKPIKYIKGEVVEESYFGNKYIGKYYRITYHGKGIYDAYKEATNIGTWKEFLNSDDSKWLPKPKVSEYKDSYRSYFTEKGYKKFMKSVYPKMILSLNKKDIKVSEYEDIPYKYELMYDDEYQVVVDKNQLIGDLKKEVTESFMDDYSENNMILFFLSTNKIKHLSPRIPNNFLTKHGYEDNKTKRICFSTSIHGCLRALSQNIEGKELYVYNPIQPYTIYRPTVEEVPDCKITNEIWLTKPVDLECVGKIKVGTAKDKPVKYTYGKNKHAELYDWNFDWINHDKTITESYIFNEEDILYNKDKFDSGKINLCFITGHSGSGKSTLGRYLQNEKVEHYELDDLQCIKDHFSMSNLKEYGDLIYTFFNGPGKKYYLTYDELVKNNIPGSEYEDILYKDFVHYAMKWAKSHKDRKFVIEGVWLFCTGDDNKPYFEPKEFDNYAFYIKGTSMIISKHRGALRDAKEDTNNTLDRFKAYTKNFFIKNWKWYKLDEKRINVFRKYFKEKN